MSVEHVVNHPLLVGGLNPADEITPIEVDNASSGNGVEQHDVIPDSTARTDVVPVPEQHEEGRTTSKGCPTADFYPVYMGSGYSQAHTRQRILTGGSRYGRFRSDQNFI